MRQPRKIVVTGPLARLVFGESGAAEIEVPIMAVRGTAGADAPHRWGTQMGPEELTGRTRNDGDAR